VKKGWVRDGKARRKVGREGGGGEVEGKESAHGGRASEKLMNARVETVGKYDSEIIHSKAGEADLFNSFKKGQLALHLGAPLALERKLTEQSTHLTPTTLNFNLTLPCLSILLLSNSTRAMARVSSSEAVAPG
jgi:hypothetical protein